MWHCCVRAHRTRNSVACFWPPTRGPSSITTSCDSSGPSQCPELMLLLRIHLDPDMPLFLLAYTPRLPAVIRALSCLKRSLCLPEKLIHSRKALHSVLSHITCLCRASLCFSYKRCHTPLQGPEVLTRSSGLHLQQRNQSQGLCHLRVSALPLPTVPQRNGFTFALLLNR